MAIIMMMILIFSIDVIDRKDLVDMKVSEWLGFNFFSDKVNMKNGIGSLYIKLFRKKSFNKVDIALEGLMSPEDIMLFFKDFEISCINKHTDENGYCTLSLGIYLPTED